jgi:hypothetical protein
MRKTTIVKLFVGSLIGLAAAIALFLVAGALAMTSGAFVMNGPDVVGVQPDAFGWSMIGLATIAVLALVTAGVVQFVAWIGAVLNTVQLEDKMWFIVLLVLGLMSLAFPAMIAYVIAGPDGTSVPRPSVDEAPVQQTERVHVTTG